MTWLAASLLVTLTAAPPLPGTVVLMTRKGRIPPEGVARVVAAVESALTKAGVPFTWPREELELRVGALGIKDPTFCDGKKKCVLELATQLGLSTVVSLTAGQVGEDISLHAELLVVADGSKQAEATLVIATAALESLAGELAPFATAAAPHVVASPPLTVSPPVEDTPRVEPVVGPVVTLLPEPPPVPPLVVVAPSPRVPLAVPLVGAGLTLAAAGVATGLAISGFGEKGRLDARQTLGDGSQASSLSRPQADALAADVNGRLTGALISGIVAGVLGVGTGVLFGLSGSNP
jgi:hypothetical protein